MTLARLRNAALPTIVISGSVGTSDIAAGAITSALTRPGPHFFAAGTLAGANYTMTLNPALTSYATGAWLLFEADADCPAGPVTVNVNGLGVKTIKKRGGLVDLAARDIRVGQVVFLEYDGTNFQMLQPTPELDEEFCTDTGAADAYAIAPAIPLTAQAQALGKVFRFRAGNANTGASTLDASALGPQPLRKLNNVPLVAGDIAAGQVLKVQWDGANWQLLTPTPNDTPDASETVKGKVELADQTEVEADTSTTLVPPVARLKNSPGVAKAWVKFSGAAGAIQASYNVTSVTKNGTGDFTINFTTPFSSPDYVVQIMVKSLNDTNVGQGVVSTADTGLAGSKRIRTPDNTGFVDPPEVYFVAFGDL